MIAYPMWYNYLCSIYIILGIVSNLEKKHEFGFCANIAPFNVVLKSISCGY
jgi:hypothetical protein